MTLWFMPWLEVEKVVVRDRGCAGQGCEKGLGERRHEGRRRKRSVNLGESFLDKAGKVIVQEQGRPGPGGPVSLPPKRSPVEKEVRPGHVARDVPWDAFGAT